MVLVVDDEPDVVNLLTYNLSRAGYAVQSASNGSQAVQLATESRPDCLVLDIMMPGLSGIEVCRMLRQRQETTGMPIIMLTAQGNVNDRIQGFEVGADDYVTKPFSPKELVLRVSALLRRCNSTGTIPLTSFAGFEIDPNQRAARFRGELLDLTVTEYKLLMLMVERNGRILSRDQLLAEVWGYRNQVDTRTVDTHIRRLREKLGKGAACVETVRGYGYRLREPSEA
ncbi:MAG: response regulator transcription factor [Verrucomicrobiia bacterium]